MEMSRLEINPRLEDRLKSSVLCKGNQIKWRKDGLWIKANSMGFEDISEYLASNLLKCSNIEVEYVDYALCHIVEDATVHFNFREHNGCHSKDFLHQGDNLMTFARLFEENLTDWSKLGGTHSTDDRIQYCLEEVFRITGLDVMRYLAATLELDALIYNADRHYGNLAVIFNETTGFRTAPIFDNGLSCYVWGKKANNDTSILLRKVIAQPFSSSFKKQMDSLGIAFTVNKTKFTEFLEENSGVLGRAYEVMQFAMYNYPALFI